MAQLNLGPQAFDAVQGLRNSSDWKIVMEALHAQWSALMHAAIEGPVEQRQDGTGYARGVRDVWTILTQMEQPAGSRHNPRPLVKPKERDNG